MKLVTGFNRFFVVAVLVGSLCGVQEVKAATEQMIEFNLAVEQTVDLLSTSGFPKAAVDIAVNTLSVVVFGNNRSQSIPVSSFNLFLQGLPTLLAGVLLPTNIAGDSESGDEDLFTEKGTRLEPTQG